MSEWSNIRSPKESFKGKAILLMLNYQNLRRLGLRLSKLHTLSLRHKRSLMLTSDKQFTHERRTKVRHRRSHVARHIPSSYLIHFIFNWTCIMTESENENKSTLYFYTVAGKTFITPSLLLASSRSDNGRILFDTYYYE